MMLADTLMEYRDGITGSHLAVGGMECMIMPHQVSSVIADLLRLSRAAFQVCRSLM